LTSTDRSGPTTDVVEASAKDYVDMFRYRALNTIGVRYIGI
jgi:hypothetical protein